ILQRFPMVPKLAVDRGNADTRYPARGGLLERSVLERALTTCVVVLQGCRILSEVSVDVSEVMIATAEPISTAWRWIPDGGQNLDCFLQAVERLLMALQLAEQLSQVRKL